MTQREKNLLKVITHRIHDSMPVLQECDDFKRALYDLFAFVNRKTNKPKSIAPRLIELRKAGRTYRDIAEILRSEGYLSSHGKEIDVHTVSQKIYNLKRQGRF